jgi:hypothetical protein
LEEFHEASLSAKEESDERLSLYEVFASSSMVLRSQLCQETFRKEKMDLVRSLEEERLVAELQSLNFSHQQSCEALRQDINASVAALYLRAEGQDLSFISFSPGVTIRGESGGS